MSFWSWIGLADKRSISALQLEISSLREENKAIREKIEGTTKNVLEKLQENSELSSGENDTILKETAKYAEGIKQILLKLQERMEESHACVLNNCQLMKECENQLDKLVSISEQLDHKTDHIDDVQEILSSLSESVKYLWTIMKAVWVDSVLSDIDSLK